MSNTDDRSVQEIVDDLTDGEGAVYDPAIRTGHTSASGNPGANNPGVGSQDGNDTGEPGVILDTDVPRGFVNPDDSGAAASRTMGAGGIGATGTIDGAPGDVGTTTGAGGSTGTGTAGGTGDGS